MSGHSSLSASLSDDLGGELRRLRAADLYRSRLRIDGAQGPHVHIEGREYVSFASNDYLALANDPRIVAAVREATSRYGVGAGASHLLSGHTEMHESLEAALAEFVGYPRVLLFSSGYMANVGTVTALSGRGDDIFADKLNHASLNDAMVLSRARFRRYPHANMTALESLLASSNARRKLVISDAVFSMDGDVAPVPQLVALCERYGAFLLLDDAHGFGVLGEHGAGSLSHFGVRSERVLYMGTLGKAAGVYGAFVAAGGEVIDYLVNRARTYIYTTATPALLAAALLESVRIIRSEDHRRRHLTELIAMLRSGLAQHGDRLLPSITPIQPFLVGTADAAVRAASQLKQQGQIVPGIRPPTVPRGSARLRISVSAGHRREDVARLLSALSTLS